MASTPSDPLRTDLPVLDAEGREQARRWLDRWQRLGPLLDEARWQRVAALTDADAAREARHLFDLWRPEWPSDQGEGLALQQAVFNRARARQ